MNEDNEPTAFTRDIDWSKLTPIAFKSEETIAKINTDDGTCEIDWEAVENAAKRWETQKNTMNAIAKLLLHVAESEKEACVRVCEKDLRDEYLRQARPIQEEVMLLAAIADCVAAIRARKVGK
jgi:vacuolar-type H+-ATPase catalytic subunit A/Vma1